MMAQNRASAGREFDGQMRRAGEPMRYMSLRVTLTAA